MAGALHIRSLGISYGSVEVLRSLDLTVNAGEALSLLGPSGSGKTTLLYAVAGFVELSAGEILVTGERVAWRGGGLPPEGRRVGMVFQNYALWPHMSALDTVAYPLRRGGASRHEARRRATDLLERLEIPHLADRRPSELSGGQQQRIGLARALARQADLYLFDEPTAHLDAALRTAVQEEIALRRRSLGAAALYATHDAAEALAVSDRVALLREGRIMQIGTPREVYEEPVDLWTARLTGPASILRAQVRPSPGGLTVRIGDRPVEAAGGPAGGAGEATLLVRPDWVRLGGDLPATVAGVWYRGPSTDYRLATPAGDVDVREEGPPRARPGESAGWTLRRGWVIDRHERER